MAEKYWSAGVLFEAAQCFYDFFLFGVFFHSGKHITARHEYGKTEPENIGETVLMELGNNISLRFHIDIIVVNTDFIFVDHDRRCGHCTQNICPDRLDLYDIELGVVKMPGKIHQSKMIVYNTGVIKIIYACGC